MSVYLIFPDLGNTKIALFFFVFVGLSLPTPCALYSCSVHVRGGGFGGGGAVVVDCKLAVRENICGERVSSGSLLVDISSLDISPDDLLPAQRES